MENVKTDGPTIALGMIVKDDSEADLLRRCLKSCRHVFDGLYVTGTNKPDEKIKEVVKEFEGEYSFFEWTHDFAAARQYNLEQIPKNYDFFFWLDADDILSSPELVKKMAFNAMIDNVAAVFIPYWYQVELDAEGNVREILIDHIRERLIKHDGTFRWIGPLHETLIEQRSYNVIKKSLNEPVVVHLSTPDRIDKNLDRNIKILEETIKKQERRDPRTIMYLAKAYFDKGKFMRGQERVAEFDKAKLLFDEYLNGSGEIGTEGYREGSGWEEERASAWAYLAEIYRMLGHYNSAIQCTMNSIICDEKMPTYYLDMAMTYCLKKEWDKAQNWLSMGAKMEIPLTTMIINRRDMKARKLEIAYQIAIAKNELDAAVRAAEELHKLLPQIPAIKQRWEEALINKQLNRAAQSIVFLVKYYEETNQKEKIPPLLQAIPSGLESEPFVSQMKNQYLPAKVWDNNEIAILCGPGFEPWSPLSLDRDGIGGSEEAVVRLSKELNKLGWKVTVYAYPVDEAGEYDGVVYKNYHEFNQQDTFNILILWRAVGMADGKFAAKQKYLWLHDVPANPEFLPERTNYFTRIFVLSEFHKSLLKFNENGEFVTPPDGKVFVTANGITPEKTKKRIERDPHRMIWTSSYDRGLIYLLKIWPKIKEAVPDAKLDICYGWNLYEKLHGNNPARMAWKTKVEELMNQPGITHRGRVGHKELAELTMAAGIHAYPTNFEEISCISLMKSQCYGAIPVVTDYAALRETVQFGEKVDVDITTKEGQDKYADALIKVLLDVKYQEKIRPQMQEWAEEKFGWNKVAFDWDTWFKEDSKKATISLI